MTQRTGSEDRPGWTGRLAVIATSFRKVGLGRLGSFVIPPDATAEQAALKAALGADELVYLATCNRVECWAVLERAVDASDEADLAQRAADHFASRGVADASASAFDVRTAGAAVEHLLAVMSGLDSLILGETEISGQMRRATERCVAAGLAGSLLSGLVDKGTACARRVRAETTLGQTPRSAAAIAVQKIKQCFGAEGPGVTVLVGTGEMTVKVAQALAGSKGERLFVNRTKGKAEELAARFGGRAQSLDEFLAAPPAWIDLLFAATAATETVIPAAALAPALAARQAKNDPRPLIVCDLGLPRDVDPAVDSMPGAFVVSMEHVERLAAQGEAALAAEAAKARGIARDEAGRVIREDRFRCIAGESASAMLERQLAHLSDDDRAAILKFATGLASRIARQPLAG